LVSTGTVTDESSNKDDLNLKKMKDKALKKLYYS